MTPLSGLHKCKAIHGLQTIGALEGQHPAGIFGRKNAGVIQLLEFGGGEGELDCGKVILKLIEALAQ